MWTFPFIAYQDLTQEAEPLEKTNQETDHKKLSSEIAGLGWANPKSTEQPVRREDDQARVKRRVTAAGSLRPCF